MNRPKRYFNILVLFCIVFLFVEIESVARRAVTVDDMHSFKTVGEPVISPDGKQIAYTVTYYCTEKEKRVGDIYLMDIDGKHKRRLTAHQSLESRPSWNPAGSKIAFSARRDGDQSQIYVIAIDGGEAVKLTDLDSGAWGPLWSPDGKWIACYSSLGQLYSDEFKKELGDVRFITRLRYTHYRDWDDGKRQRIFVVPADGSGKAIQLTKGDCADEGDHSMAWDADSKEIVFVSNRDPQWWNSIDTDIYTVSVPDGKMTKISQNRGPDHSPAYSPDGKYIAFRSIFTYNYESENYKLVVVRRSSKGKATPLTTTLDRNVRSFRWSPDSETIYFLFGNRGVHHVKAVSVTGGPFRDVMVGRHVISDWNIAPDGKTFIVDRSDDQNQEEIFAFDHSQEKWRKLTTLNDAVMAGLDTRPVEEIWAKSKDGAAVQGWLIKPVGFKEGQKYPMILSIHGGPHGMSTISYRFFFQLLAGQGYVLVYANPRASLGYGETFSRQIWEDWGGRCYHDLMAVVDEVLEKGFVDEKRLGVMGGSFGGYMTFWMIGQTDRFAAAFSRAGLSNLTSFYGTTDEQFFPEAEFSGAPWQNRDVYLEHSPLWYAANFKTPCMIVHGQYDFRVKSEQSEQMFTALQKQNVPSVYVWFPDEGHSVRQPKHRKLYYNLIIDWFNHYLKGEPSRYLELAAQKPG